MPSKDMSEILSRCRTGDLAAQEQLVLQPIRALLQWRRLLLSAVSLEVLGIDDCEQVSNIFAYNPTSGDRIPNDEIEWTVSDPTVVTYDPVNAAINSASRKIKEPPSPCVEAPFG